LTFEDITLTLAGRVYRFDEGGSATKCLEPRGLLAIACVRALNAEHDDRRSQAMEFMREWP